MSTMHRNAPHRSRPVLRLQGIGVMAAIGLALVGGPARAADGPNTSTNTKPRASERGLDDAARRALRASSSRSEVALPPSPPSDDRVAMRAAAPAESQDDPPKRGKSKKKASKGDDDARAPGDDGTRKISLDEDFLVEGKLEKPNAFYILRRSQSGYDWARLDAKFLPLVLESVQDPLF